MPSSEFFFLLEFASQGAPAPLIEELAGQVFRHVGCPETSMPALIAALEKATAHATGGQRRCEVQFRVHNRRLDVMVTSNGGRVWQDTLAIP